MQVVVWLLISVDEDNCEKQVKHSTKDTDRQTRSQQMKALPLCTQIRFFFLFTAILSSLVNPAECAGESMIASAEKSSECEWVTWNVLPVASGG